MSHFPGIHIDFPSFSRADGSASFGFGSGPQATTSLCGPIEVVQSSESPLSARLETQIIPLTGIPGIHEKKISQAIHSVMKQSLMLKKCPRTLVQIVVQEVCDLKGTRYAHNDDVVLASMINSATLAAIKAGSVPMRGVVCATAVCLDGNGTISPASFVSHPTDDSPEVGKPGGVFAFLFALDTTQCVYSSWHGGSMAQRREGQKVALERAKVVWNGIHFKVGGVPQGDEGSDDDDDEAQMEI